MTDSSHRILVLDDEPASCKLIETILVKSGYAVTCCTAGKDAIDTIATTAYDLFITDYRLGDTDGIRVCEEAHRVRPGLPVVLLTSYGSLETAIAALRVGVIDFVPKATDFPKLEEAIVGSVQRALELHRTNWSAPATSGGVRMSEGDEANVPVGDSEEIRDARELAARASQCNAPVLIEGEPGTEKAEVALAIHWMGARSAAPFEIVDTASLVARGLENAASPDAISSIFERAARGTLYIDNLHALPRQLQVSLMRTLSPVERGPLGAAPRVICGSSVSMSREVQREAFRTDLYYRVSTIEILLPPLRARGQDILAFARSAIARACGEGRHVPELSTDAAERLLTYAWPGNALELERAMVRAVSLARGPRIVVDDLPAEIRSAATEKRFPSSGPPTRSLEEVEQMYIGKVLAAVGGNKASAARVLGVDRTTLYRKLQRFGAQSS